MIQISGFFPALLVLPFWLLGVLTAVLVLVSTHFATRRSYNSYDGYDEGAGFLTFLFGPLAVYVVFEFLANLTLQVSTKDLLVGALVYVLAGMAWTVYKWRKLVMAWLADRLSEVESMTLIDRNTRYSYSKPRAKDYKGQISLWLFYWPLSAVGTLTGDFTGVVIDALGRVYSSITNSAEKELIEAVAAKRAHEQQTMDTIEVQQRAAEARVTTR